MKKYRADTQEEALKMASDELGQDAIVLSIKKVTPRGIFSGFKKPYVEVSAVNSLDADSSLKGFNSLKSKVSELLSANTSLNSQEDVQKTTNFELYEKEQKIRILEMRLKQANDNFQQAILALNNTSNTRSINTDNKYKNSLNQFIYDLLKGQQVRDEICREILDELDDNYENQKNNIDFTVKKVYNKVLSILEGSKAEPISNDNSKGAKKVVFLGNTGVGKTTTIAKISSNIIMGKGEKVSFITLDTYRIAATEQLKIYADILDCDVEVVYDLNDLQDYIKSLSIMNDFIFFDTAGRSHNSKENMEEIKEFIKAVPNSDNYLVLSAGFKFEDMMNIISIYSEFTDFKLIFTKLDETNSLGNILNIAKYTDKKIAYLTDGQNVPSDVEEFSPTKISKTLLENIYK